jgi:hypothetical protein
MYLQTSRNGDILSKLKASVSATLEPNEVWEQQVSWLMSFGGDDQTMTRNDAARHVAAALGPRPEKEVA